MPTRAEKGKHMPEEAGSGDAGVKKAPTGELHGEGSEVFEKKVSDRARGNWEKKGEPFQVNAEERDADWFAARGQVQGEDIDEAVARKDQGGKDVLSALKKPLENVKVEDLIRAQGSKGGKYARPLTESEYQSELEDLAARYPASERPDVSKAETSGEPAKKEGKLGGWESKPSPWPWQEKSKQDSGQASSNATKDIVGAKSQRERFRVPFDYETPEGQAKIAEAKARQQQELSSGSNSDSSQPSTAEQIAKSKEFLRGSFDRENLPLAERKKVFAQMNDELEDQRLTPEQRKEKAWEEEKARAKALKKKSEEFLKGEFTRKAPDIDRKAAAAETTARLYPKTREQLRDEAADEARAEKAKAGSAKATTVPAPDASASKVAPVAPVTPEQNPLKAKEAKATVPAPKAIVPAGEGKKTVEASTSKQPATTPEPGTPAGKTPEEIKLQQLNEKAQGIYKPLPKIAQIKMASEVDRTTQEQIIKLPKEEQAKFSDKKSAEYAQLYVENLQKASDEYNRVKKEKKSPLKRVRELLKKKPKEEPKVEPKAPAKPVTAPRPAEASTPASSATAEKKPSVPPVRVGAPAGAPVPIEIGGKNLTEMTPKELGEEMSLLLDELAGNNPDLRHTTWLEASKRGRAQKTVEELGHLVPAEVNMRREVAELRQMLKGKQETPSPTPAPGVAPTPEQQSAVSQTGGQPVGAEVVVPVSLMTAEEAAARLEQIANKGKEEPKNEAPAAAAEVKGLVDIHDQPLSSEGLNASTATLTAEQPAAAEAGEGADEAQRKIAEILAKDPNAPAVEQPAPTEAALAKTPEPVVAAPASPIAPANPVVAEASIPVSPMTAEEAAARLEQIANKGKEEPKNEAPAAAAEVKGLVDVHDQPLSSEELNALAATSTGEQPAVAATEPVPAPGSATTLESSAATPEQPAVASVMPAAPVE